MLLLPYRTFSIESPLTPSVAEDRLRNAIQATRWFPSSPRSTPFEGVLNGERFKVQRAISYRNSFLPCVQGALQPTEGGVRLVGTMRLHAAVIAFITIWFAGIGIASASAISSIMSGKGFHAEQLFPLGMLAFGIALVLGGFIPETRKALRELASIVEATKTELR